MSTKYTKDQLIEVIIKSQREMGTCVTGVENALHKINKQNVLHSIVVKDNTSAIKQITKSNESVMKFISLVFLLLVGAVIILAGAEKVFKYIPFK